MMAAGEDRVRAPEQKFPPAWTCGAGVRRDCVLEAQLAGVPEGAGGGGIVEGGGGMSASGTVTEYLGPGIE